MVDKRKNDISYHETAKLAAISSYREQPVPDTYWRLDYRDNRKSGFYADVLTNGKEIIIAYRGTNSKSLIDVRDDFAMYRSRIPEQATEAIQLYDEIRRKYPNVTITLVGHSLGGSLAQIVSAVRGALAITFNAYGTKNMFASGAKLKTDNIVNYVNENDVIAMNNASNNIGETFAVSHIGRNAHDAESMGALSGRVARTPEELRNNWYKLHPRAAAKQDELDSYNSRRKSQRERDREQMRRWFKEYQDKKQHDLSCFKHAYNHNPEACTGSYYVQGYTRKDGTTVGGYIRDCWLHGN